MEIKKPVSPIASIIQPIESAETEKKSVKSSAAGITSVKDGFEVVRNNGGLFSESRSAQQSVENSGKKQLSPAEQQEAFKLTYKDFKNLKNPSSTSPNNQNPQIGGVEEGRSSGTSGSGRGEGVDAKTKEMIGERTAENLTDLHSPMSPEQTNDAVKQLTSDTNLREYVNQEVTERHQEFNKLGGKSPLDRIASSLDPAASTQPNAKPFGKDQIAYERESDRKNKDGTTTHVYESTHTFGDGSTKVFVHESTKKNDGTEFHHVKVTEYRADNSKKEYESKENYDANGNLKATTTTTTTQANGTVTTSTSNVTKNKDGSSTTETTEKTTPGGGTKSYDAENYKGNLPEELQRTTEYFKEKAKALRPPRGGERILTDGGASGTPVFAGGTGIVSPKMGGITGMVGQPRPGEDEIGNGTGFEGSGVTNADANGGATDVDGNNWTGRTIEDDPQDVHFGPAEQPKKQTEDKSKDSDDSPKLIFDLLRRQRV